MIENNLNEISEQIQAIVPVNWVIDISSDSRALIITRRDEKNMKWSDINFFDDAASNIAKLIIEVKQLREVNAALKRQIVKAESAKIEETIALEKDLRFL